VRCPWHGSTFRLSDGKVVRGPAAASQPVYEARVTDGKVEVRAAP
jgi:nitrite reductase/ring-hydroxylating ferredoxin subunit